MSNTWFTSDLHIGHKNIGKFRNEIGIHSQQENEKWLSDWWDANISKRDQVIVLGDAAFTEEAVDWFIKRPGTKRNYGGNHDDLPITSYLRAFAKYRGCEKYHKLGWLSHFPVHPDELRGKFSIHGHTHFHEIDDFRYINVCCDNLFKHTGQPMISIHQLRELMELRRQTQSPIWLPK